MISIQPPKAIVPWFREPWPWLLMVGPALVVVAGTITAVVAFRGADALVAEDYYKQGLAINRVLERDKRASALHVKATVWYAPDTGRIRVQLYEDGVMPNALQLRFSHATKAEMDRSTQVHLKDGGIYEGAIRLTDARHWTLAVEGADWRVESPWDGRSVARLSADGESGTP
jgi:hypothetical protein